MIKGFLSNSLINSSSNLNQFYCESYATVMSIPLWTLRSTQDDVDVREFYGENNALFSLKEFSVIKVTDMVNKLGYSENVTMFYHFKKPSCDLDNGLHTLRNDYDVLALSEYVRLRNKVIEVYVEHRSSTLDTYYETHQVTKIRWNDIRDMLRVGQSSQVTEVGQSSQSNHTPNVQPNAFVDDFYAANDPFIGQGDFEPLFGLDDITPLVNVGGTFKGKGKGIEVDMGDKGKGIALDDEVETLDDAEDA
ncbi:hypothetical protein Tco_1046254 [Tanacetum coccineum]